MAATDTSLRDGPRHCEERSDEAISYRRVSCAWRALALIRLNCLLMTQSGQSH